MNGSSSGKLVPGSWNRYICINGGIPSGGVDMLALSMWLASGSPFAVLAPSSALACTASPSTASKFPAARLNPIGGAARWSWKRPRNDITWTAFCARLACQEPAVSGSQVHTNDGTHAAGVNGWSGNLHSLVALGATSSVGSAMLSSLTSS